MNLIDLTGKRFGRWTVLYRSGSSSNGQAIWRCKCECGNEKDVQGGELRRGKSLSCGCLQKELARQKRIKSNHYELFDDYGIGHTYKGDIFFFDIEDYEKIKDYCWFTTSDGYISAKQRDGSGNHVLMHNIVTNQKFVDHIGGEKTRNDNRKCNLRVSDNEHSFETYNNMNKSIQKNNKSGCPGVIWHKRDKIWEAYISIDKKRIYLGRFDDYNNAVFARIEAEKKYFGEYSYDNSQKISEINKIKKG